LAGYEFVSSVILLAGVAPFLKLYQEQNSTDKKIKHAQIQALKIVMTAFGALGLAILIHAYLRGTSIIAGLESIVLDVKRRTHGNSQDFPGTYADSLDASSSEVLRKYFFEWNTPVLNFGTPEFAKVTLGQNLFLLLIISCVLTGVIAYAFMGNERKFNVRLHDSGIFLFFYALSIPLSWFILASAHSYIHTHINFVLWYLLTIPVLIWISGKNVISIFKFVSHRMKVVA